MASQLAGAAEELRPYVTAVEPILWEAIDGGERVILEGAQSTLLDVDHGTYPFVTSSHPTTAGALEGSGLPPGAVDEVVGVLKGYATRVGAGPFPTEDTGEQGAYLQQKGGERGATTGRPRRCGWLDLVLLRYAARLNGFTALAVTKVDVLGGLREIPVCVEYRLPSGALAHDLPPTSADDLARVEPVYVRLPGWPELDARMIERIDRDGERALPRELRQFLGFLEEQTRIPVRYVSYGPGREATLDRSSRPGVRSGRSVRPWSG